MVVVGNRVVSVQTLRSVLLSGEKCMQVGYYCTGWVIQKYWF